MKTARMMVLFSLCLILNVWTVNMAEAGNGTLIFTYKYQDPATGVITAVPSAFIYLHDAAKPPPMEKYFSMADHILWGSFGNGNYQVSIPEGTWFIRINERADVTKRTSTEAKGPPRVGDFTWIPTAPITIKAGQTINLGTIYATSFNASPTTLTGTVKTASGAPLAGYYVRVQTEPCVFNTNCSDSASYCEEFTNQCGPAKYMSLATDASGVFSVKLRDPGTYYVYATSCFPDGNPGCGGWCAPACVGYPYPTPITVQKGDSKTINITAN
ncbi:carboxypeptidase-like regulatory domain-containing protein [Geomonas sp.]|uniref:carboxypeptidase-like regulatory domain-containing protein n=1 Tax=Geomonas sp. TaxID=2651584 RepID=UPI002B45B84A|nr:carboxypeptidase-like regulatory domain-containing protein [Geomonas sp.]HJV36503.1 carboxypeptidase-like regulatory domain-containing protein [Geomonas sp.]